MPATPLPRPRKLADPCTEWLKDCAVGVDDNGFIRTGLDARRSNGPAQPPTSLPLEPSVAGVFAIGDVRAGSTKRVGAAIGEGAAVVAQIHSMLAAEQARA